MKIYPSITTVSRRHWEKLKEVQELGLTEVCFFATGLTLKERKEFYPRLRKSSIKSIPLVHLKDDSELWELDFFIKNFQTRAFNCHLQEEYRLKNDLSQYKKQIFVENTFIPLKENEIKQFAGICIDFSHLEVMKICQPKIYRSNLELIKKYPCACAHISAAGKIPPSGLLAEILSHFPFIKRLLSAHFLWKNNQVDYLLKYKPLFPPIMALELENCLRDQLKVIDYLSLKI